MAKKNENSSNDLNSRLLLSRYVAGEDEAATSIFDRYVGRLLQLARTRMSGKLARRVDAEDVVQSAYRSFFVHARDGDYVLRRAGDLWRLLAAITLNKLYGQVELHTAQKRDVAREDDSTNQADLEQANIADVDPLPDEVAEVTEQLQLTMHELGSIERQVLERRLSGQTIEEVASEINRSQRTVRRMLESIRQTLENKLQQT